MAAFRCNGEADKFISDLYGMPALEAYFFGLKRINCLLKILFTSLFACQALSHVKARQGIDRWIEQRRPRQIQLSFESVGKVLEMWSCQVSESSSTSAQISPVPAANKLRKLPNIR